MGEPLTANTFFTFGPFFTTTFLAGNLDFDDDVDFDDDADFDDDVEFDDDVDDDDLAGETIGGAPPGLGGRRKTWKGLCSFLWRF